MDYLKEQFLYDTDKQFILVKSEYHIVKNVSDEDLRVRLNPFKYSGWDYNKWSSNVPVCIMVNTDKTDGSKDVYKMIRSFVSQSPLLNSDSTKSKMFVTDDVIMLDSSGKYQPEIWNLLPVSIKWTEIKNKDTTIVNLDFWFVISKEFAELLPERYRTPILSELEIISRVDEGSLDAADACKSLKGEKSYFGICSIRNGIFKEFSVYPNPLTGNILNINFNLAANNNLTFEIYSYDGNFISTLKEFEGYEKGVNKVNFILPEISQGIYFLTVKDKNGNIAIEKIVKSR